MRAKVTIFDEETGQVFAEDKLIAPYREDFDPGYCVTNYEFRFGFKHMKYSPPLFEAEEHVQNFFDKIEKEIKDEQK